MSGQLFVLLLVFGTMCFIFALVKVEEKRNNNNGNAEETETIQELYRGLEKMGRRIEALETILLDQNEKYRHTPPPMPREELADRY